MHGVTTARWVLRSYSAASESDFPGQLPRSLRAATPITINSSETARAMACIVLLAPRHRFYRLRHTLALQLKRLLAERMGANNQIPAVLFRERGPDCIRSRGRCVEQGKLPAESANWN